MKRLDFLFRTRYRRWLPWLGGALLWLGALLLQAFEPPLVQRTEGAAYDLRLLATLPGDIDTRIAIVDIDERSLAREGQWPWPRTRLAQLVDRLFAEGAAVVAFDVVFAEADEREAVRVLQDAARDTGRAELANAAAILAALPTRDADFARSLAHKPTVLGYYFNVTQDPHTSGVLPPPLTVPDDLRAERIHFLTASGFGGNIAPLQTAAAGGGYFIAPPDADGNLRRMPLIMRYKDRLYGALALEVLRVYAQVPAVGVSAHVLGRSGRDGIDAVHVGPYRLPTDLNGLALIPYRGPSGRFPYVSASEVLQPPADARRFAGKIVLVGTTAPGLKDLRATPVQTDYPGVETHANIISAALDTDSADTARDGRRFKQRPSWAVGADALMLAIVGALLVWVLPRVSLATGSLLTLTVVAAWIGANALFWRNGYVLALALPLIFFVSVYALNTVYGYFFEVRSRRALMNVFGQYVPPALVAEIGARPEQWSLAGESREMTVLFADIRGFTAMSERLAPTEVAALLNRFFTPMTEIIHAHRGTIDKYVGDMIMAFWGAPLADPAHARHALDAAMAMIAAEDRLRVEFTAAGLPPIAIAIGLNTGTMNVGNMGSAFRMAYTVIGDAVNLASRLEGLARVYGARIVVGEATQAAHPDLLFRELDRVRVRGRERPLAIYEPLAYAHTASEALKKELDLHRQGLKLYRERAWDLAELQFLNLHQRTGARLYELYIARIQQLRRDPPPADWAGVFDFGARNDGRAPQERR